MKNPRVIISANLLNSNFSLRSCNYSTVDPNNIKAPIKTYANADVLKLEILKENKGKSGVYIYRRRLQLR